MTLAESNEHEAIRQVYDDLWALIQRRRTAPDHSLEFLATLHPEQTAELAGNTDGLLLLGAYALRTAMAQHDGYHEHIDEAAFAKPGSLPVIISRL